ncbi:sensor histidine kinase [Hymenobacter caeli]|uniref:histidine kinase n=1 Tax=Hymenobacter caeli TaxID=2735894 RepID=A0ABX2FMN8_9BACT|nr:ATP-binding protein [Hymenobacter caeli]NRT17735.1 signal transduction histidine kinase [Hymenobacter caeli]
MDAPSEVAFGQLLFGGIGFMLLAAALLVVFLVTYQKRLLQQQLRLRAAEAEYQQQLLTAVIEAQERERERIGRDLHDGIGSTIATAKLLVNRLGSGPPADDAGQLLGLVQEIMGAAVLDVRSISHSLYPAVLARFGLAEALQHLVDVSNETGALAIGLAVDYPRPLPLAEELALYRICQELLHNALKHARGATRLDVRLRQQGPRLVLEVEDDGCGFVPLAPGATKAASGGAGLRSIEVRVQMLHAHLRQQSAPGAGTRMAVEMDAPEPAG